VDLSCYFLIIYLNPTSGNTAGHLIRGAWLSGRKDATAAHLGETVDPEGQIKKDRGDVFLVLRWH